MPRTSLCTLVALLPLGALSACGEDLPRSAAPSPDASVAASSPAPSPALSPSPAVIKPAADFTITYRAGKVSGDTGRLKVKMGATVTIEVTSDVADEVHLHGYDVRAAVGPGVPARLTFLAKVPGVFELELERLGERLASVQVQ